MSYSLIVIDFQPDFSAAFNKSTLDTCKKEIRSAIRNGAAIVFVEYHGSGQTLAVLTDLTKDYNKTYKVIKNRDGGGYEVTCFLRKQKLPRSKLKVVGVNTDACVQSTVFGLHERMPNTLIEVNSKGCWSNFDHQRGLNNMATYKRVAIR